MNHSIIKGYQGSPHTCWNCIHSRLSLHQTYSASDETRRHTSMYHAEIVKAIQNHDADEAAKMMNEHLTHVEEALTKTMQ
ncbi:MAG: FCD domain-containing protein [Solobacterium sp.]|nr:FCD domain-containing protein [Solobacterium sp.]